jgi:hypothetical protein
MISKISCYSPLQCEIEHMPMYQDFSFVYIAQLYLFKFSTCSYICVFSQILRKFFQIMHPCYKSLSPILLKIRFLLWYFSLTKWSLSFLFHVIFLLVCISERALYISSGFECRKPDICLLLKESLLFQEHIVLFGERLYIPQTQNLLSSL